MKRRILSLLLALTLIIAAFPAMNVMAAVGAPGTHDFVGPKTYTLDAKYFEGGENATASGSKIDIKAGGKATFGFYLPFNAQSITVKFAGDPGEITVATENGILNIANGESNPVIFDLNPYIRLGEKVYTISSETGASISSFTFNVAKELTRYGTAVEEPAISDEEFMAQCAIIIKQNSPMIMVGNGRRYVNLENPNELPLTINGTVYLPAHTAARAFGLYLEDLADKNYLLLRKEDKELVFTKDFSYSNNRYGDKKSIDNIVYYKEGKAYLPVRPLADYYDYKIGYANGTIAIDDNRYYVADYLDPSTSVYAYIEEVFADLTPSTALGTTYYVAKTANASDNNPGTEAAPFLTISKAGQVAQAGDTVIVKEGTYRETVTVKNNGTPTAPIKFVAENENVVISACEEITGFIPYGENQAVAAYPYDLGLGRNQVFYNNKSVAEARYPNGPIISFGGMSEPLSDNWPTDAPLYTDDDNDLHVTQAEILDQPEDYWNGAIFTCLRGNAYATSFAQVKKSKPGELELENPGIIYWDKGNMNAHVRWGYISAHRNCIDVPGEWVVENNTIFMMPPEGADLKTLTLEAKARHLVVDIPDNKCIQFEGFTTIGGSMRLNNSELCVIKDCTIRYNNHYTYGKDQHSGFIDDANVKDSNGAPARGEVGLYVGGRDNIFMSNVFDEAAAAAIYGVGLYTYIENNIIKNCGYAGSYVAGINFIGEAWKGASNPIGGAVVVGNTAYNAGRSPLQTTRPAYNSLWPRLPDQIMYNDFHDGMLTSLDTGVIYTYMTDHGNNRKKTTLSNNFIYWTGEEARPYSFGTYQDGGTDNVNDFNNLVFCTEPKGKFTVVPYNFYHKGADSKGQTAQWENKAISRAVTGGRDGLIPNDYPYGMMFDAGSNIGRDAYTKNYEMIINNSPELNKIEGYIGMDNIEVSEGVTIRENGDAVLKEKGDWVRFKDVDFGLGKNQLSLYYKGDRYTLEPSYEIVFDDLEKGRQLRGLSYYFMGRSIDDASEMSRGIPTMKDKHDVYVRLTDSGKGALIISGMKIDRVKSKADDFSEKSFIFGGSFEDYGKINGDFEYSPEAKFGAQNDSQNAFVNNTWTGSWFLYPDVEFDLESDLMKINYCTGVGYGGQKMQIRLGSIDAEPVGEWVSGEPGWSSWTEVEVPLKKTIEKGTYDVYVTFFDDEAVAEKTLNLYYINFGNMAKAKALLNTLYGGSFVDFTNTEDAEFDPEIKFGAGDDQDNPFVNNTWPGTVLTYKDVEIKGDVNAVVVSHCTAGNYSGQSVQIRIGKPDAKPIAEFKTLDTSWSNWTELEVKLKETLKEGTYDIYVSFIEPDGKYASKSANFHYFRFKE